MTAQSHWGEPSTGSPNSPRTDQGAPVADLRAMPRDLEPLDASAGTDWRKKCQRCRGSGRRSMRAGRGRGKCPECCGVGFC